MHTHLIKHGDEYAVVIDSHLLETLHLTEETPLDISTDGTALVIAPGISSDREKKLDDALGEIHRDFAPALKKLAG